MKKQYPILYSRDSTSKILSWSIEVKETLDGVKIYTEYGEYYGKKTPNHYLILQGKNIGKANETTPFQQAINEAEATWKKQKKKGYKSTEDLNIGLPMDENYDTALYHSLLLTLPKYRTDINEVKKPMLCQQYYRNKKNWTAPDGEVWDNRKYYYLMNPFVPKEKGAIIIKFPCILQPKINGVRCFAHIELDGNNIGVSLTSKDGEAYKIAHISIALSSLGELILEKFNKTSIILDGELYIHGMALQDINSCVKKPNLNTHGLVYKVFDLAIENNTNIKRVQALNIIKKLIPDDALNTSPIQIIESSIVQNDLEIQHDTDVFINMKYEGSIQRNLDGMYEFGKRPMCMTKLKRPTENTYQIMDVVPQKKDPNKGLYVCQTEDGLEFEVNPKGTDEFKTLVLATRDLFVGKMLFCVFYEYTKDNKPFHIIFNKVQND